MTFFAGALLAIAAHAGAAMTLDERIACREKIEDVYWAHRLWPKENQGQKPAREAIAPHATIAAQVEESLRYETGGSNGSGDLNTGGRYTPATDTWLATDPGSAPVAREQHTAVWTGSGVPGTSPPTTAGRR